MQTAHRAGLAGMGLSRNMEVQLSPRTLRFHFLDEQIDLGTHFH
jgi:hypothetical protein